MTRAGNGVARSPATYGAWLSLVERLNGVQEVLGSNPSAPTNWAGLRDKQEVLGSPAPALARGGPGNPSAPTIAGLRGR